MPFIPPANPQARSSLPTGDSWVHEPKLDGWRLQAHKHGRGTTLFSKSGLDLTRRFHAVAAAVATLPATSAILDGEVVALDDNGNPDFLGLHRGARVGLVLYAFDLLHLDSLDLREMALHERKKLLANEINRAANPMIRLVQDFEEGAALLAECERRGLEGVVSKRRDGPYRSGPRCGWIKVKTKAWRSAHRDRGELFRPR